MRIAVGLAAIGLACSAQAGTIFPNIPASTDGASSAAEVSIGGSLIFRYGTLDEIPSPFGADSGFYIALSDPVSPLGGSTTDGPLTYGQFVAKAGSGIFNDVTLVNSTAFMESTFGPDAPASGVTADYYFLFAQGPVEDFGSAHVDAAGTLVSLTYSAIPEPSDWMTMLVGLGLTGALLRRREGYWTA